MFVGPIQRPPVVDDGRSYPEGGDRDFRPSRACAVQRCWFSVGVNPTRQLGHSSR
jgi:hypothetical protein